MSPPPPPPGKMKKVSSAQQAAATTPPQLAFTPPTSFIMRAKRSKKYRKLMHQYELTFGFREPYQVLVDSNFLRAVSTFKMDLIPALERTLQGKVKPLLTKCSLAAIMAAQPINAKTGQPYRPMHLPPPTEVPLRHCSHNQDSSPIDEVECLLSLLSPTPDAKKNKEHYTLATADPPAAKKADKNDSAQHRRRKRDEEREEEQAMRRARSLRIGARSIPGVPIIYVKRSVMVLEPMSTPSEAIRDGVELSKLRAGLDAEPTLGKRKRETGGDADAAPEKKKKPGMKKIKGPNPLSVKKSKKKVEASGPAKPSERNTSQLDGAKSKESVTDVPEKPEGDESAAAKTKRRRRHHKGGPREGDDDATPLADPGHAMEVDA